MALEIQQILNILAGTENEDAMGAANDLHTQLGGMSLVEYIDANGGGGGGGGGLALYEWDGDSYVEVFDPGGDPQFVFFGPDDPETASGGRVNPGGDIWITSATEEGTNFVYVWDGAEYVLTGGRTFIGPNDPAGEGFTVVDGDMWETAS